MLPAPIQRFTCGSEYRKSSVVNGNFPNDFQSTFLDISPVKSVYCAMEDG